MNIVLDIIILATIIISVAVAVKKGFLRTLVSLVSVVAIIVLISLYAAPLGSVINKKVVSPALAKTLISQTVEDEEALAEDLNDEDLENNSLLAKIFKNEEVEISASAKVGKTVKEFTVELFLTSKLLNNICVGIASILIIIAVKILAAIVNMLFKAITKGSFLNKVNKGLGFVLGLVNALLLCFIICSVVNAFSFAYEPKEGGSFESEVVENTYVYKYVGEYNPIKDILE